MTILQWGVTLGRVAPAVREHLAVSRAELPGLLQTLSAWSEVQEALVLATCQRLEVYLETLDAGQSLSRLRHWGHQRAGERFASDSRHDTQAITHLFAVAAGKDSLTLGESEILRQLREAWRQSWEAGVAGPRLNGLFQHALRAGKLIRHQTAIGRGRLSLESLVLSQAAVTLELSVPAINWLVIGLGGMGQSLLRQLRLQGATQIRLLNRHPVANLGSVEPWDALPQALGWAQAILVCTGAARPVLGPELWTHAAQRRVIMDLAVPRNVDPALGHQVSLLSLDDFTARLAADRSCRAASLPEVDRLLAERLQDYHDWRQAQRLGSDIKGLYDWIESLARQQTGQLDSALRRELRARTHDWLQHLKLRSPELCPAAFRESLDDLKRQLNPQAADARDWLAQGLD